MDIPKISQVAMLVEVDSYSQVELYARIILLEKPADPHAMLAISWAHLRAGLLHQVADYFAPLADHPGELRTLADELSIKTADLDQIIRVAALHEPVNVDLQGKLPRYLLIKAWGFGFWSDVLHVLGGLMLAEITRRQPVVHWGTNSLYSLDSTANAFGDYFSLPGTAIGTLVDSDLPCYPPKWHSGNLRIENNGKTEGDWAKMSGLHLMAREENICVMDYYIGVLNLMPYIPQDSAMHSMSIDQVYLYLINKYLELKPQLQSRADAFAENKLESAPFLAVHVRGSDKVGEFKAVDKFHSKYQQLIPQQLARLPSDSKIFLMTDDSRLLKNYLNIYGDRIVTTDCLRTDSRIGIHYQAREKARESAFEVIIDTLIASKAACFVGNGFSNPSIFVYYLGQWQQDQCMLIGGNRMHHYNTHLYKTIDVI